MTVIYAEKADVGNKIAAALGGFDLPGGKHITFKNRAANEDAIKKLQRSRGYLDITFRGEPAVVIWGYGHLYRLSDVSEYDAKYKSWRARPVCFIPEEYKLKPIGSDNSAFDSILNRQRSLIKDFLKKADTVINATDYDREGELIFAYVCDAVGFHKPYYRVLFTSQTEEGIRKAFDTLIPSAKVKGIEQAGRARSIYDWLVGTNLTTQMTLRCPGNDVLSIGRVQTPTLKMVVDREEAIRSFVPKISWNIKGTFDTGADSYSGLYKGSGEMSKADADSIISEITGMPGVVTKLEKKRTKKEIPLLYSQTSLQIDANKYYGYTAKQTMEAAQHLYEGGYASYPRTKSQYLTDDMEGVVIKTLTALASMSDYEKYLTGIPFKPARKFFDSSKVISHYAIIPTGELPPSSLPKADKDIFDLLAWSLIRTIYPEAVLEKTSVVTTVNGKYDFASSGTTIVDAGWMTVNALTKETVLPTIRDGASYPGTYEGKETKTEPPKRYDDGSLVKAMKTAGKELDDATFRAILADPNVEGLGTDATRAEIIETLLRRKYIERKGKVFYATDKGIDLIHTIPVPEMMSAEFTARMEQSLSEIEQEKLPLDDFLRRINDQVRAWCDKVAAVSKGTSTPLSPVSYGAAEDDDDDEEPAPAASKPKRASSATGKGGTPLSCPSCGHELIKSNRGWYCSGRCGFSINSEILSHKMKATEVKMLLTKGGTKPIDDFVSKKTGKKFTAKLVFDKSTGKVNFAF